MNVKTLTEELAERLKLEERAQQDAVAGLPETMATSLTAAETGAVAAAEQAAKEEVRIVAQAHGEAEAALNHAKSELEQVRQARETIEDEAPPSPPNLDRLAMARDRATAAYAAFKSSNGLTREATGDDRSAQVIWAVVVMVVESLFNAYFYGPISSLGLLGGLFTALFVSFANVGVAFVGGAFGLRFLAHVEPAKKLGGTFASLLALGGCALVVALSALFRGHVDALGDGDLEGADLAGAAWDAAVLSLQELDVLALFGSLNSFLLVFVGAICALVGFWKGWEFDDPYPGFGAALRSRERAEAAYDEAQEAAAEARRRWWQAHRASLRQLKQRLDGETAKAESALAGLREAALKAAHPAAQAASLMAGLLSIYRQKNEAVRATPAPAYFSAVPSAADFTSLEEDLAGITGDLPALEAEAGTLAESCNAEQARLQAAISRAADGD